jgi:putative heme-binding domain-containing protein
LKDFPVQTPAVRRAVRDAVVGPADRASLLLNEIEEKRLAVTELDRVRADRLLTHSDPQVAARAKQLLAEILPADRKQALADYQPVLKLKADAGAGREVFRKNCSTCHRVAGVGVDVAPDISDTRTKTAEQLLADILQPNRAIDNNYVSYAVVTADGQTLNGVIAAETATSVTLKQAENKIVTLLRQDIEELRSTGISLMPDGLEKNIPPQEMADLLSFLKNWRYVDGQVPLGK